MKNKYALIVEDDALINSAYSTKFTYENIPFEIARDGEEALLNLEQNKKGLPSVIMLDMMLPKKNGFEILEIVKKNELTKKIPVIALTNLSQETERKRAMELGASEYLVKADIKMSDLLLKIRHYLS